MILQRPIIIAGKPAVRTPHDGAKFEGMLYPLGWKGAGDRGIYNLWLVTGHLPFFFFGFFFLGFFFLPQGMCYRPFWGIAAGGYSDT